MFCVGLGGKARDKAKKASGITISQHPNCNWRVRIRKKGFPPQSGDFRSHTGTDEWGIAQPDRW